MVCTESVYRYGRTRGEVVDLLEVGPGTHLPIVGETITLSHGVAARGASWSSIGSPLSPPP